MNHEPHQHPAQRPVRVDRVRVVIRPDDDPGLIEAEIETADPAPVGGYVRVYALAELVVCGTGQVIASPGTWRVPSGDRAEIETEGRQAYDELVEILSALGVVLDRPFESVPLDEDLQ